jgi:hypothetical protein
MVSLLEFDGRYFSTQRIFEALSEGLKSVRRDLEESEQSDAPYFEVEIALDQVDALLGIAFVTAQTYITGTVSDLNLGPEIVRKSRKEQLLKNYCDYLPGLTLTKLELVDAMANYFKHHDEWPDWSASGPHQRTVTVLRSVGIDENDHCLCVEAANILLQHEDWNLTELLQLLSTWRKAVVQDRIRRTPTL